MLRVFLVPEGVSLSEDLSPTENVSKLQTSLARQCGVSNEDIILLTAKGRLLDSSEILGSYDGGTEEKPFYVYFRPGVSPHSSYADQSFERNAQLEIALSKISAMPSSSALQHHLTIAKEFVQESIQLVFISKQMHTQVRYMWAGWQALLLNFSSMKKNFESHHRTFATAVRNFDQSANSYKDLLERTPEQLEMLKKIGLPSFMSQSVFGNEAQTLYDWINSQDDHSNLDDLLKECQVALNQVNHLSLNELQENATNLTTLAAELLQKETTLAVIPEDQRLENISQEQKSVSESIQTTVKRVLGSGDAAALANVSHSNCKLLKLMHGNHKKLENALQELQNAKNTMKDRLKNGLNSLAVLQQEMTDVHTKVQFYCGQLQLTHRRFEVLEQICATPDMMKCVLNEMQWRKSFKSFFVEEGTRVLRKFEQLRENEKNRRQGFFERCGQHFILSLFPSLTDRIPRLFNSVPQRFDDDICSLPQEELEKLLQILQCPERNSFCFSSESSTQTETIEIPNDTRHVDLCNASVQAHTHTNESHTQTLMKDSSDFCTQTDVIPDRVQIEVSTQVECNGQFEYTGVDNSTQFEYTGVDNSTQFEYTGVDSSTQIEYTGVDNSTQFEYTGVNNSTQFEYTGVDSSTQIEYTGVDNSTQFEYTGVNNSTQFQYTGVDSSTQIEYTGITQIEYTGVDSSTQIEYTGVDNSTQFEYTGVDNGTQFAYTGVDSSTQIEYTGKDNSTQFEYTGVDSSTQFEYTGVDSSTQFKYTGVDNSTQFEYTGVDNSTQFEYTGVDNSTQFEYTGVDNSTQFEYTGVDNSTQSDIERPLLTDINKNLQLHAEQIDTTIQTCTSDVSTQICGVVHTQTNYDSQIPKLEPVETTQAQTHSDIVVPLCLEEVTTEGERNVDLHGQVVALNAAVEGLKSQLMAEREHHRREREKMLKHSLQDSQEMPTTINIANLKLGDVAIFLPDVRSNFLALTFDDRMYYLNHTAVEKFTKDISSNSVIPLKRKVYLGVITEKVLVEVRKENNRLQVPVGHRLYKVTAREIPLPPIKLY